MYMCRYMYACMHACRPTCMYCVSIHPSIDPWAQRPLVSNDLSLGQFLGYCVSCGLVVYHRFGCPSLSPSPSISRSFSIPSSFPAIGFHSCFFFTADVHVSAPIRSTLNLLTFYVSFQAWDWHWYPMVWFQRQNRGAHEAEISIQISAMAGVESQTLAPNGRERYH